jgi:hypothetical protein
MVLKRANAGDVVLPGFVKHDCTFLRFTNNKPIKKDLAGTLRKF